MSRQLRRGFTLVEVAVAAVILATLAAVTMPALMEFLDKQRAQTTADKLSSIATGIAAFAGAVHTAAGTSTTYPGRISELANVIGTTTATRNSCGGTFNTTAVTSWNTSGPFITFMITTNGFDTPLGIVADSLARSPAAGGVGTLSIRMIGVDQDDATELDKLVDGADGSAAGIVQWGTVSNGQVTVTYTVPIANRC